ncbi:nucleotidyltransferase family protein [Streptomyces tsukubensis]|uniref:4-diphosphocytidyl-2C-methyl-D-erythritol synthase n=1 Tax=Streptomyces tsukubensis TaxID=83656 RepID=A0A1V4ADI4_9ACTN|nr:nucleotidyltransferase family protein [Streptomyces tsukubensis]OON81648.1 4-diphosphocytidyl-2C-methyl-D-erythritol synthase [Streptomyces tsukubensis]QFR96424.1 NTP transferase domain-containing protein [Streptomyces tsukubensis]
MANTTDSRAVTGILLAAGGGRRLGGRPKALLGHRGGLLVEHAVRTLREGGCDRVHVVLGASASEVRARAELTGCTLVENPLWESGMGSSLRAGLDSLRRTAATGALVTLVDQPGIGARAVTRVRTAWHGPATLVAAAYEGRRGHPVLFGSAHWEGVMASASGDRGARAYLSDHASALELVECSDIAAAYDIDTPEDLARLTED